MANSAIGSCARIVEAATKTCVAAQPAPVAPPQPNWDAMANSFASLSAAFAWGSLIITLVAIGAAFAWGRILTAHAEKEARKAAEAEVRQWLRDTAMPLINREMSEFSQTFRADAPISTSEADDLATAAGANGKEGDDGKK